MQETTGMYDRDILGERDEVLRNELVDGGFDFHHSDRRNLQFVDIPCWESATMVNSRDSNMDY